MTMTHDDILTICNAIEWCAFWIALGIALT